MMRIKSIISVSLSIQFMTTNENGFNLKTQTDSSHEGKQIEIGKIA